VAVGVNADGRLEAFTVAGIGELWHTFQRDRAGGPLSPWETLGRPSSGTIRGGPSIGTLFGGGLEVFVVGNDGTLQHRWQAPGWQSWAGLGRPKNGALGGFFGRVNVVGTPTAASNQDARVEVFARGTDGAIWHRWMDGTFNWPTGWALLGMRGNDMPTLVRNDDGTLALYTVATDGTVFHIWQQRANNGWGTWETLGNPSPPRVEDPPTEGTVDVTLHQKYTGSGIERVPVVGMCLGVVDQGTIPDAARVTTVTGTFVNSDGTQPGFPTHADPVTGRPAGGVQMQPGVPSSVFTGQRPWGLWEAQVTWQPPSQDVSGELQVTWKVP
jgi:hypothetical protein